ncbi:helix-turn-helix domain-containing protein [Bacillus sp. FSL R12-0069]|uniref:helix-turn-helix domain-containing protein n=1 Tax=Bacillus sp. FSL R12-0069 TaxID=2975342 RepID=UPI0030F4BCB9
MLIQRQKDLLLFLIQDKKWHTFSQIAKEINCSTKTVQRDILIIKEVLPPKWNLQICKGKGVILHKPVDSSCTELNSVFIRNELSFKILDILFKPGTHTISSLSEKLYVSPPSLYIYLKNTEYYLSQFNLQLKRKPLKIYGNSINLIFMYQEFYIHSYADHEWPFTAQEEKVVHLYVMKIEEKLGIILYPIYKRKLMYLIAIMCEKKKQGLILSLNDSLINKISDTPFYVKIFTLNNTVFQNFFTIEESILILIAINCSKYVHQNLLEYKENLIHHFHKNDVSIYRNVKELIFKLEEAFKCELINNSDFIFAILQYLKQILSQYQFFPQLFFSENSTTSHIMNVHKDSFFKVKKLYIEWVNKYSIKTAISNEEIATLTLYIEGICMLNQFLNVKILLLIEDGEKWELYLKGILNFHFGPIFKYIHTDIQDITTYDYTSLNVDLIITTFSSVHANIPIVRISIMPTRRELKDIKDFIYKNSFIDN